MWVAEHDDTPDKMREHGEIHAFDDSGVDSVESSVRSLVYLESCDTFQDGSSGDLHLNLRNVVDDSDSFGEAGSYAQVSERKFENGAAILGIETHGVDDCCYPPGKASCAYLDRCLFCH